MHRCVPPTGNRFATISSTRKHLSTKSTHREDVSMIAHKIDMSGLHVDKASQSQSQPNTMAFQGCRIHR